jgi:hypothetical protein
MGRHEGCPSASLSRASSLLPQAREGELHRHPSQQPRRSPWVCALLSSRPKNRQHLQNMCYLHVFFILFTYFFLKKEGTKEDSKKRDSGYERGRCVCARHEVTGRGCWSDHLGIRNASARSSARRVHGGRSDHLGIRGSKAKRLAIRDLALAYYSVHTLQFYSAYWYLQNPPRSQRRNVISPAPLNKKLCPPHRGSMCRAHGAPLASSRTGRKHPSAPRGATKIRRTGTAPLSQAKIRSRRGSRSRVVRALLV